MITEHQSLSEMIPEIAARVLAVLWVGGFFVALHVAMLKLFY